MAEHKTSTSKYENNMFPVIKLDYSGKIIYHNVAAMPILSYWQCKLNAPVNNQVKAIYPEIFNVKTPVPHDASVQYLEYLFHFSVIPYPEAGYIGIYGHCIEEALVAVTNSTEQHHSK
ncbi:MAG TPA: hypothetical protein PLU85_12675 [Bacteroidia bacterium]|nr:hypothetical protein [Bacteroidia bacterium]QQR96493.1 MAG: hypothetical protein IPJ93_07855 [Bacteroidota bacterium]MBP7713441.1 hypothetical protein [Bacteroidia bacterium]MBP8669536.1 hypothetical protein [Bacteroidia bacterium]HOZ83417.1 hypothetical protein [Bacteroidia bacterium]